MPPAFPRFQIFFPLFQAFMRENSVCSINSINWARIAAQSSYYVWATLQMSPDLMEPVNFVVPTGAFGNAMGGFLAKKMGVGPGPTMQRS